MSLFDLFISFLKASTLSIGGLSSLPLLRQELVGTGIITEQQVLEAIAISRLSPGPGGLFVVSLGYFAGGVAGSALALTAAVVPPLAFVLLTGVFRRQLISPVAAGVIRGIALSTAGLVVATGIQLVSLEGPLWTVPIWQLSLAGVAAVVTIQGRLHPVLLIGLGAAIGLIAGPAGR
jgi:chromate transporter